MKVVSGIVGLAAVGVVVAACGGSSAPSSGSADPGSSAPLQHPASLVGVVGHNDAFRISLTDPNGQAITDLAAGTYSLTVKDESAIHNFHLSGNGVDRATPVGSTITSTFNITLKPGTYTFVCDPHASQMKGSFTVG